MDSLEPETSSNKEEVPMTEFKKAPPKSTTCTYRFSIPLIKDDTVEINFLDLVEKQQKADQPIENATPGAKEEEKNDEDSSDDGYVPLEPGQSRLTSVIDNIERIYDGSNDLGYDREDSFIDDSDLVFHRDEVETENQYGGFFIHRGELEQTVKKRRSEDRSERSKQLKKQKSEKKKPKEKAKEKSKESDDKDKPKDTKDSSSKAPAKKSGDSSASKLPDDVEDMIKEFQAAWDKADANKLKRFPPELDGHYYKICKTARELQGFLTQALMERFSFLPFQPSTLKARFTKLSSVDSTVKSSQENLQNYVEKLKTKLASRTSDQPLWDSSMEELVYNIVESKLSLIKALNSQRKLEGIMEVIPASELNELLKKVALFFPEDSGIDFTKLHSIHQTLKKRRSEEEKKIKDSKSADNKKPPLSDRRKKKTSEAPGPSSNSTPIPSLKTNLIHLNDLQ